MIQSVNNNNNKDLQCPQIHPDENTYIILVIVKSAFEGFEPT